MKYPRVARAVFDTPWPITPTAFGAILEVIEMRLDGGRLAESEIRERLAVAEQQAGPRQGAQQGGAVAVIPIYGVLTQRANLMTEMSGGTSVQRIQGMFRQALADPSIGSIVFDVDSPGGSVAGIPELADEIREARGQKPMVAVANTLMASAAYWLACSADEIVVSPSALVGSIGVLMAHTEFSAADAMAGVKTTLISAGKYKVEGNEYEPLGDEALAYFQSLIDDTYALFTGAVAKSRGVNAGAVRDGYGQGRVVTPKAAVSLGMADRVGTLDDAIARAANPRIKNGRAAAGYLVVPVAEDAVPDIEDVPKPTDPVEPEPAPEPETEPEPEPTPDEVEAVATGKSNDSYRALARSLSR